MYLSFFFCQYHQSCRSPLQARQITIDGNWVFYSPFSALLTG